MLGIGVKIKFMQETDLITLAGGCFWCLEGVYKQMDGVVSCVSGYMGGHTPQPTYKQICTGTTGHAEVVQVTFNPAITSLNEILAVFFTVHDPTTMNRQGNDSGTQYRSEIFFHSPEQELAARNMIGELESLNVFDGPIVTAVTPAPEFFPAEGYHQNYYFENPNQSYCQFVVAPKIVKFRDKFKNKFKAFR
jgi:methionine-S-sulfoxide reductase